MGHRFEAEMDSSVRNLGKNEKKDKPKLTALTHIKERSDDHDIQRENEVLEFVKLLENSGSPDAMKALLLRILNSDKCEELKPFLKDRSSHHDRSKKQSVRRSSKIGRPELLEQGSGSSHNMKSGTRKSTRPRIVEQGGKNNTTGGISKTNNIPMSPGSSLRRSRQSDSCLRKSHRDGISDFQHQKSRLASSSSLLQLRTTRRGDLNRRRIMVNLNQGEMQAQKQNASWDPVPGASTMGKRRTSTGSFMKSPPISPENQNASWDSACLPAKGVAGVDKLPHKALGKISEKKIDLGEKKNNLSEHSGGDKDKFTSKMNNSFAQFEPTGQVAYREQTVRLHDLVDDLRSNRDSIGSNIEAIDQTTPEKKGLRKYLTRPLTKKKGISRDKQSIASEPTNDNYKSLSDENQFHLNDLNDSITSNSVQNAAASYH